jgi:2-polyprenyl-3-methyl-5-hydroxy-6-metoxy-1,4-benzoquinol methylase
MDRYYEYGYWENRRSKETIARNGGPASYTDRSRRIVEMLQASGIGRSSNVLEIGCGTGTNLAHVCDAIGCSIAGIEPSMEESQIASSQLGVSIRCGTLSSMEATEQGKYDAVILAHVLEHLYDPFGSLAIIRR